ncbi:cobyrinate a,c-diamide synthase [Fodinicurvata sediminis]|uniref:cobyrinate a,c-diamide synthase n=1 Tax=Fodinicurvata sediminis TaxID=1121832 RepID=UPI0003B5F5D7|nr:cobyrinate a,c-diamide synthase [Fodinicurvata sediminis]
MPVEPRGLVIAATASGSGKTTLTLGLLRALRRRGFRVSGTKVGPDYIDPAFHAQATGQTAYNMDPWAMSLGLQRQLFRQAGKDSELVLVEGVMGLFDAASSGVGSTADVAVQLGLPIILVVDVRGQAQSVAALVEGFRGHRPELTLGGLVLNRVGSSFHMDMLRSALEPLGVPLLGGIPRDEDLKLPNRHLGLVQAGEHKDLEAFLERAADRMEQHLDLEALLQNAAPARGQGTEEVSSRDLPDPPGQTVSVARDACFSFLYPHLLHHWRKAGAELHFFSPLENEPPRWDADAIYLPGGYPELHAEGLSQAKRFRAGMVDAEERGVFIYGECGGYMTLGDCLTDDKGRAFPMLGLLPLHTSFERPRLHLGYRQLRTCQPMPFWKTSGHDLAGHEFHYASTVESGPAASLFQVWDARGGQRADAGLVRGSVAGSFLHLISGYPG